MSDNHNKDSEQHHGHGHDKEGNHGHSHGHGHSHAGGGDGEHGHGHSHQAGEVSMPHPGGPFANVPLGHGPVVRHDKEAHGNEKEHNHGNEQGGHGMH